MGDLGADPDIFDHGYTANTMKSPIFMDDDSPPICINRRESPRVAGESIAEYDGPDLQPADTPQQGCSLKPLPTNRRKPQSTTSAKNAQEEHPQLPIIPTNNQSKTPTSRPSSPFSDTSSTRQRLPSEPPEYEMDGPYGGENLSRWRRRYAKKFETFTSDMTIPERTVQFDKLAAKNKWTFSPVFATYYWSHLDQIPDREISEKRAKNEETMMKSNAAFEGVQKQVFKEMWLNDWKGRSPFSLPKGGEEGSFGPKDERLPDVVKGHSCAYCKKTRWRRRGRAASECVKAVMGLVELRKRTPNAREVKATSSSAASSAKTAHRVCHASKSTHGTGSSPVRGSSHLELDRSQQ